MSAPPLVARWPGEPFAEDASAFSRLLEEYHLWTEHGKGGPATAAEELAARYRAEIDDPARAFARDTVLLGALPAPTPTPTPVTMTMTDALLEPVGCVVLSGAGEGKRLWVDPAARGHGLGSALVRAATEAAVARGFTAVRLSVWEWQTSALTLAERLGFAVVQPWDTRPGLVALRWDAPAQTSTPA
ncbi:GNAT family N-acetyltransferase [Herbiconiux sp. P15]|uniref:GNAT family N-acetyltransferase n=1 Tax=Herbiconiux liukaitaii TaxID=3342799 RepID=UPI0035B8E4A2